MLTDEQIEIIGESLSGLYQYLESAVIADVARRIKKTLTYTRTAELQAGQMAKLGFSPSHIRSEAMKLIRADKKYRMEVAKNTMEYKREVKNLIQKVTSEAYRAGSEIIAGAGNMSWESDLKVWKSAGKKLNNKSAINNVITAINDHTNGDLKNITRSMGFRGMDGYEPVQNAYQAQLDRALIKLTSGTFSADQCVVDMVKDLSRDGIRSIDYIGGRSYQLDDAARMCLRTTSNQLSAHISDNNMRDTKVNMVQVSAHWGARDKGKGLANHSLWQGKVFYTDGSAKPDEEERIGQRIGDLLIETGYNVETSEANASGLHGINCRHQHYPFFEGVSNPVNYAPEPEPKVIDGRTYTYYDMLQEQRKRERKIRKLKREREALASVGADSDTIKAMDNNIRLKTREYKNISNQFGINTRNERLRYNASTADITKTDSYKDYQKMSKDTLKDIETDDKIDFMKNTFNQPDIKQPRVSDYPNSDIKKSYLLNVMPEDLSKDMSLELRNNIVRNANEVYHLGTKNNVEYATVFDSKTGKILDPVADYRLITQGKSNNVYLDERILTGINEETISIAHNHTNGTIPSNNDIDLLMSHDCIESVYLVANGRLIRFAKIDKIRYNKIVGNVWDEIDALVRKNKNIDYAMADSNNGIFAEIISIFSKYGISLERW